jgi:hypothetical protein
MCGPCLGLGCGTVAQPGTARQPNGPKRAGLKRVGPKAGPCRVGTAHPFGHLYTPPTIIRPHHTMLHRFPPIFWINHNQAHPPCAELIITLLSWAVWPWRELLCCTRVTCAKLIRTNTSTSPWILYSSYGSASLLKSEVVCLLVDQHALEMAVGTRDPIPDGYLLH